MLNTVLLYTVRAYVRLGLFFYFKKIHVINGENIPKGKPLLILPNHQNALLDALIIAAKCKRFSYFLTRASVFNYKRIAQLLNRLRMLPVYRMRDGFKTIKNNQAVFKTCLNLLDKKESLVIFPEGNHNIKRMVRPLSKGFTRLVFDSLEKNPNLKLQLIPVGFNYRHIERFADEVSLHIGEPIPASHYAALKKNDTVLRLKSIVHKSMSTLTTHIPNDGYSDTLQKLESLNVDFLNPESVNSCIEHNFSNCKVLKRKKPSVLRKLFKGALILNLLLPYLIWKLWIKPKIKEVEFISTFRFLLAITLVPIYLLAVTVILHISIGWWLALIYLFAILLLTLFVVKF